MKSDPGIRVTSFGPAIKEAPVVSVNMITYNHGPFIREAIESVFAQDFDGSMELVIGEDCSTDNTRAVIEEVCREAPIPVRLLTSKQNVGMHANGARTLRACGGRYVALLEGDDKWQSRDKTSKQVALLDADSETLLVLGRCEIGYVKGATQREGPEGAVVPQRKAGELTLEDIYFNREYLPTCTAMFRRSCFNDVPAWFERCPWGDLSLWALLAAEGKVVLMDECVGYYRVGFGMSAGYEAYQIAEKRSEMFFLLAARLPPSRCRSFLRVIDESMRHLLSSMERQGEVHRVCRVLKVWVTARLHAGLFPADIERWLIRCQIKLARTRLQSIVGSLR